MANWSGGATGWRICCGRMASAGSTTLRSSWKTTIRYVECCAAGERAGLYYTCINSYLAPDEVAYIINNSESKILITSQAKRAVALAALERCPNVRLCLIADGDGDGVF